MLTPKQWLNGAYAALSTLAAQAVAYGSSWPQGMEWVAAFALTGASFFFGARNPDKPSK